MKKITFLLLCCCMVTSLSFAQSYPSTPMATIPDASCDVTNEFPIDLSAEGIGVLGTTNQLDFVTVDISHTWVSDITITLVAPDATEVVLIDGEGGSGDDFTGTVFVDGGTDPITPPFTGDINPLEALTSGFNGVDADGVWVLRVCDGASGDEGTLNAWSLNFGPAPLCTAASIDPPVLEEDCVTEMFTVTVTYSDEGDSTGVFDGTTTYPIIDGQAEAGPYMAGVDLVSLSVVHSDPACDFSIGDFSFTCPQPGDACSLPIMATVETDCSLATPITIDYSTAVDLGTTDLSCDTIGVNTGAWLEFTTTATGAITLNMSDSNEYAIFDACGGIEIVCNSTATTSAEIILSPSTPYKLAVWKDSATVGSTDVCIEEFTPPMPPECAEEPISPSDAATGVVLNVDAVTLSWTAPSSGPPPTDYRILFGDTSGALGDLGLLGSADTTVEITGLDFDTTYFWTIVPLNGSSEAAGPCAEWSFTTELPPPPPANDEAAGALDLPVGDTMCETPVLADNVSATDSNEGTNVADCSSSDPEGDVWYKVTVPFTGEINIETSTTGEITDTVMIVYRGTPGSLVEIECDDDDSLDGLFSLIELNATDDGIAPGDVLYVRVWEWNNDLKGTFNVCAWSPTTLGIDDNTFGEFSYYPNPVKNTLTLNAQNTIEDVTLYNMLGQVVMKVTPNTINSEVDMSSLANGAYFVQVTIANVSKTIRVIKQ